MSFVSRWHSVLAVMIGLGATAIGLGGCAQSYPGLVRHAPVAGNEVMPSARKPLAVLGPGDEVEVFVWGYQDLSRKVTVNYAGALSYPLVGQVPAAGKTVEDLEQAMRSRLSDYIKEPIIKVSVASVRPYKFLVLGEVKRPGVYVMTAPNMRLFEGVAQAGGFTDDARQTELLIIREVESRVFVQPIDFSKIPTEGRTDGNVVLAEGDIVYVPVLGMADAARTARRFVDVLSPVLSAQSILLNFQSSTILWEQFVKALRGEPINQQTIIVPSQ